MTAGESARPGGSAGPTVGTVPGPAPPPRLVCKVGGSLLDGGRVPPLLAVLRRAAPGLGTLLLAGGGRAADRVRAAWRRGRLGRSEAHWAAVRALDANALRLAGGCGARLPVVTQTEGPREGDVGRDVGAAAQGRGGPAVLAPGPLLRAEDPLPHGWDVTSDSIAAWAADRSGADDLLLLKARGRRGRPAAASGSDGTGLPAASAAAEGLVDGHLPVLLRGGACRAWVLNGRHPDRLLSFLAGDPSAALRLLP